MTSENLNFCWFASRFVNLRRLSVSSRLARMWACSGVIVSGVMRALTESWPIKWSINVYSIFASGLTSEIASEIVPTAEFAKIVAQFQEASHLHLVSHEEKRRRKTKREKKIISLHSSTLFLLLSIYEWMLHYEERHRLLRTSSFINTQTLISWPIRKASPWVFVTINGPFWGFMI